MLISGYDKANQAALTEKGLWRIDSGVDAITRFTVEKNVKLFEELGVSFINDYMIIYLVVLLSIYLSISSHGLCHSYYLLCILL